MYGPAQITVIEDEGQQIELPENEDEKKLFTKLKAEGYAHSYERERYDVGTNLKLTDRSVS